MPRYKGVYHSFADPSHGWIKVSTRELFKLGIINKISPCSYYRNGYVYLEEDCDASLFLQVKRGLKQHVRFIEHYTNKCSRIRSYRSFYPLKIGI